VLIPRSAVVTGAASGIGLGAALGLAASGAAVCLADRDAAGLEAALAQARDRAQGGAVIAVAADVSGEDGSARVVAQAMEAFGRIDILVNCAGIKGAGKAVSELTLDDWQTRFAVNATSCFLMARAVIPGMVERRWGRIISVSSQLALRGSALRADYCASKAAIHGLTFALARELASSGITVNAVAPGPVMTAMLAEYGADELDEIAAGILIGRLGQVDEIVPAILMLAAETGAFITGTVVNISGGDVISA
jgi:3-oxoacyl-[acyl-carrier protein] reductase